MTGHLSPGELKAYFRVLYALASALAVLAYVFFQLNYHATKGTNTGAVPYSFLTHTFSHLGSFDNHRNPGGWFFFSGCLMVIAFGSIPLNAYIFRRLRVIDPIGAGYGSFLLGLGAIGAFLVAVFPDSGTDFLQDLRYGRIHSIVAVVAFVGLGFGTLWMGLVIARDHFHWVWKLPGTPKGGRRLFDFKRLMRPFLFFWAVAFVALSFIGAWEFVFPIRHAADPTVKHWPGEGIFSFPLWEWILILALFLTFKWFILALPHEIPSEESEPSRFV